MHVGVSQLLFLPLEFPVTQTRPFHIAARLGLTLAVVGAATACGLSGCRAWGGGSGDRSADGVSGEAAGPSSNDATSQSRRSVNDRRAEGDRAAVQGITLAESGMHEQALAEFERAIRVNPQLVVAYVGAGQMHQELGDYVSAESRFSEATRMDPTNFDAHFGLGLSLQLMDRVSESIRAYLAALTISPESFDANLNIATAFLQLGEARQAQPYAQRAVRLDQDSGVARVNLGAAYAAQGFHDLAVLEYQQAAELMELNSELLLNLADSLGQTGRYEEMAATLTQLVRVEPSAVAHERLGSAMFRLRRYDQAEQSFRNALAIEPNHFPALNGVGVCLLNKWLWSERTDSEAREEAVGHLRRSLRIEQRQPTIIELIRRYG